MESIFSAALIFGGGFVLLTLLLGHADGDVSSVGADDGAGAHADATAGPAAHGHDMDETHMLWAQWLPFLSLRFWVYATAGFGLTGTLLTTVPAALGSPPAHAAAAAVAAVATGLVTGTAAQALFRWVQRGRADSQTAAADFVGREATALLPIEPGRRGKVRVAVKGQIIDAPAVSPAHVARGERVVVTLRREGVLHVEPLGTPGIPEEEV